MNTSRDERRKASPSPIKIIHAAPPSDMGRVHTLNFTHEHPGREESWLAENGIAVGYVYEENGLRLMSYVEPEKVMA